jgi:hypothetical protein
MYLTCSCALDRAASLHPSPSGLDILGAKIELTIPDYPLESTAHLTTQCVPEMRAQVLASPERQESIAGERCLDSTGVENIIIETCCG